VPPDARAKLQAEAPRGKKTRPSNLVLRKRRNEVSETQLSAPNETHLPVGRIAGKIFSRLFDFGMLRAGLIELQGPDDYLLLFFCYASKANEARFTAPRLISLSVREKDFSTSNCSRFLARSPSCRLGAHENAENELANMV